MGEKSSKELEKEPFGQVIEANELFGFKGLNPDLTCQGFQYVVGQTYEIPNEQLIMCQSGFHFCRNPKDVLNYYPNNETIVVRVKAEKKILEYGDKCVTSKITILEVLPKLKFYETIAQHNVDFKITYQNGDNGDGDDATFRVSFPNGDHKTFGLSHRNKGNVIVECYNGDRIYYCGDQIHREGDQPAIDCVHMKAWLHDGEPDRKNGPAVQMYGTIWLTPDMKFDKELIRCPDTFIKLDTSQVSVNCGHFYYQHGLLHREDGPAVDLGFAQLWYIHGQLHRIGGPAVIIDKQRYQRELSSRHSQNGSWSHIKEIVEKHQSKEYYFNGVQYNHCKK